MSGSCHVATAPGRAQHEPPVPRLQGAANPDTSPESCMPAATRRILLVALFGGVLFDVLVVGNALGVNAPIVMAAFLGGAFLLAGRDGVRRMDPADAWLAPAALVLSALAVLRADDWLVAWDVLLAAALAAGSVACLAGGRITRGLVPLVLDHAF